MITNSSLNTFVYCLVSERAVTRASQSLLSPGLSEVNESSVGLFNITCTGASMSGDLIAIADFTGTLRIFRGDKILKQA